AGSVDQYWPEQPGLGELEPFDVTLGSLHRWLSDRRGRVHPLKSAAAERTARSISCSPRNARIQPRSCNGLARLAEIVVAGTTGASFRCARTSPRRRSAERFLRLAAPSPNAGRPCPLHAGLRARVAAQQSAHCGDNGPIASFASCWRSHVCKSERARGEYLPLHSVPWRLHRSRAPKCILLGEPLGP